MTASKVPVATEDFHGDGEGSDVATIWSDRLLGNDADFSRGEHLDHGGFIAAGDALLSHDSLGNPDFNFERKRAATRGFMSCGGLSEAGGASHPGPFQSLDLGAAPDFYPGFEQAAPHATPSYAEGLGDGVLGHAAFVESRDLVNGEIDTPVMIETRITGETLAVQDMVDPWDTEAEVICDNLSRNAIFVQADTVIEVASRRFSGHVYNLETKDGLYRRRHSNT